MSSNIPNEADDKLVKSAAKFGDHALSASASIVGTAMGGPAVGVVAGKVVDIAVSNSPKAARCAGGMGAAVGGATVAKCVIVVGGIAAGPAVAAVALGAAAVGGVGYLLGLVFGDE